MQYTPKVFQNDGPPYINETALNDIENFLVLLGKGTPDYSTIDSSTSTSSNYNITINNNSTYPSSSELPLLILFTSTVTNTVAATITPQWDSGSTAYPIYDLSTNASIAAGEIILGQPCELIFDGIKFWFHGGGKYLKYGNIAGTAGYWDKIESTPTSTTNHLTYNGVVHVTELYGSVYNPTRSDFAEGYEVEGEVEPGDLIAVDENGIFRKNVIPYNSRFVGFVSDNAGIILGTQYGDTLIATAGRVAVKVEGTCSPGDLLVAGRIPGTAMALSPTQGVNSCLVVGKALQAKDSYEVGRVLAIIRQV